MLLPIIYSIRINNEEELAEIMKIRELPITNELRITEALGNTLKSGVFQLVDSKVEARVLVQGKVIATGPFEEMLKRYKTESEMHTGSNLTLQKWADGDYKTERSRRHQI